MPQLPLKAFAALAKSMAGAADDEILAAARSLSGEALESLTSATKKKSIRDILESGEDFGILSAGNPMGKAIAPEENLTRHSNLMGRVRELGYEPLEQRGVYGGTEEPSLLVPGLTPDLTKQLGREFEQEAVISSGGWHRLADDATFPRQSVAFPEQVDDFYSEIVDPVSGQPQRYQLQFPDEAFGPPTPSAPSAVPSAPSVSETAALSPSPQDSTAPALVRMPSAFAKGLGPLAKGIRKTSEPGVYELSPKIKDRVARLFEIGNKLGKQSDWSGGENEELIAAFGGDRQLAQRWARLFGATSPGTSVPVNTRESLSALEHHFAYPGVPMTVQRAHQLDPVITMAGSKVPSINRAYTDQPLTSPKPEELAKLMVGRESGTPIDIHALWGMGSKAESFKPEIPALRAKMTKAEGLPHRGGLTNEEIYYRTADALTSALNEIAPELPHNPRFAQFWEGVRAAKGLKHQGGPLDILRQKGLLKEAAMLDPFELRIALKSAGWTAGAITAVLKASSVEAADRKLGPSVNPEPRPQEDPDNPRPAIREWAARRSRAGDITLPSSSSRAKTAAPMNARVSRPKSSD